MLRAWFLQASDGARGSRAQRPTEQKVIDRHNVWPTNIGRVQSPLGSSYTRTRIHTHIRASSRIVRASANILYTWGAGMPWWIAIDSLLMYNKMICIQNTHTLYTFMPYTCRASGCWAQKKACGYHHTRKLKKCESPAFTMIAQVNRKEFFSLLRFTHYINRTHSGSHMK